jgi:hypothetical protein
MTAGTETNQLRRIVEIGLAFVVLAFEPGKIDEQFRRGRLSSKR